MATSSNFGNMFSLVGASLIVPFLPLLPTQVLLNNLLYDVSQTTIPSDNVDEEQLRRPAHWDIGFIRRFMTVFGPLSSVFDFTTVSYTHLACSRGTARPRQAPLHRAARHRCRDRRDRSGAG